MESQGKIIKRKKRKLAFREKVKGTLTLPRLAVFRSAKHLYLQLIDDEHGQTLISSSDLSLGPGQRKGKNKKDLAFLVGEDLAKKALKANISQAVFDRAGFLYHGRVAAAADGARKGGLRL